MILKNKIFLYLLVIVLIIWGGISTYKLIETSERAESLEAAVKILETDYDKLLESNKRLIDSIATVKKTRGKVISEREKEIELLLKEIDSLLNLPDETPIDNMRHPDSIYDLFARYYPDHTRTGKGSNQG